MTILEAINKIDSLKPNSYSQPEKLGWLSNIENRIHTEILKTHEPVPEEAFVPFDESTPLDTVLTAPSPYDELYIYWLAAQIDMWNRETASYNNSIIMFSNAYTDYANYYNREHRPVVKHIRYLA